MFPFRASGVFVSFLFANKQLCAPRSLTRRLFVTCSINNSSHRKKWQSIQSSSHPVDELTKNYSRFSANNIMTGTDTFRICDYDIIGFDLDNTLLRYKVSAMVQLEYEVLANYLVQNKGYSGKHLLRPFADGLDFLQKGLIVDLKRGNILKVSGDGYIRKASHGTRFMDDSEICSVYGVERKWDLVAQYTKDLLSTWNGPCADSMRSLLDYFDMPAALIFARCVDTLDESKPKADEPYDLWNDILDGIYSMYSREHFQVNITTGDCRIFNNILQNLGRGQSLLQGNETQPAQIRPSH